MREREECEATLEALTPTQQECSHMGVCVGERTDDSERLVHVGQLDGDVVLQLARVLELVRSPPHSASAHPHTFICIHAHRYTGIYAYVQTDRQTETHTHTRTNLHAYATAVLGPHRLTSSTRTQ